MILKLPQNPIAIDLIKSCKDRYLSLDRIEPIILDSVKLCAWCYSCKTKGPKYCGKDCANSARAHAYPQKEESLFYLLSRQDFKCALCLHDYIPLIEQLLINGRVYDKPTNFRTEFNYWLMKRLKSKSQKDFRPEIDHRQAIWRGNPPLSIGLEGVWCLCHTCHLQKTSKIDLAGPRKKLTNPPSSDSL
jgi:hypothetical protein